MSFEVQQKLAEDFLAMHFESEILLLAGAWDVSSAKVFELEGVKAIGTTSAGIASSLGYADGEKMNLQDSLAVVTRIVNHCRVPVSADIEAGYTDSIEGIIESTQAVIHSGAVGLNIEDSTGNTESPLFDLATQVEKIKAIRHIYCYPSANCIYCIVKNRTEWFWDRGSCQ